MPAGRAGEQRGADLAGLVDLGEGGERDDAGQPGGGWAIAPDGAGDFDAAGVGGDADAAGVGGIDAAVDEHVVGGEQVVAGAGGVQSGMHDAGDGEVAVADGDGGGRVGVDHDRRAVGIGGDGCGGGGAGQHGAAGGDQQRGAVVEEEFLGGGCGGQRADLVEVAEPDRGAGERVGGDGAGRVPAGLGAGEGAGLGDQDRGRDAAAGLVDVAGGLQVDRAGYAIGDQGADLQRQVRDGVGGRSDGDLQAVAAIAAGRGAVVLNRADHGQAGAACRYPAVAQQQPGTERSNHRKIEQQIAVERTE